MARKFALALVLFATISTFALATANNNCTTGGSANFNGTAAGGFWAYNWPKNTTVVGSRKFIVGGSENWHFGFNYSNWAISSRPFYMNDSLVFKYDAPNATTFPHSVYLLPNLKSYQNCDLKRAKRIADANAGVGEGFEFVLKRWQPYYFACGEREGFHCRVGNMKFAVVPLFRWYN
ncbi:Cupredoxin superfamily protein [Striga hermonthica]|uniref:Cupredoxin superfamily protein n=1 Tax=Striga hermonthica TaxID=68872 RepID=A0A9N7RHI4_STRHE|nr:Cupredoxin superfamily protein [Striga hermonthica]